MKEFSIIPKDNLWEIERFAGSHRHEIFGGANRPISIKYGLVIYLTPKMHNIGNNGIHFNKDFMEYAHKIGQKAYMEYYNKTIEDFIKEFGRNYL